MRSPATAAIPAAIGRSAGITLVALAIGACDLLPTGPKPGSLLLSIKGLDGNPAAVQVTGPAGFDQTVATTTLLQGLKPGPYTVFSPEVSIGTTRYAPLSRVQTVEVKSGAETLLAVPFVALVGTLVVDVTGVPDGTVPSLQVTGAPTGNRTLTMFGTTFVLAPGAYKLSGKPVVAGASTYVSVVPALDITIASSATTKATMPYTVVRGSLDLGVTGLPQGLSATATIGGPAGFTRTVSLPAVIGDLLPGVYAVSASPVASGSNRYRTASIPVTANVASGQTTVAQVRYSIEPGFIFVAGSGLPNGATPAIVITGPSGFSRSSTVDSTVEVPPGVYVAVAHPVTSAAGYEFVATPSERSVTVTSGKTATAAYVYATKGPNYRIDRAYVVQAAQDSSSVVPVIAGKPALVRVFAVANQAMPRADVRLTVYRGSTVIATYNSTEFGGPTPTRFSEAAYNSWDFHLDSSVVWPGLRFMAEVNPTHAVTEANYDDNRWPSGGATHDVGVLDLPGVNLVFVPLRDGSGRLGDVTPTNVRTFLAFAADVLPARLVPSVRAPLQVSPLVLSTSADWSVAANEMWAARYADGDDGHWYGVADVTGTGMREQYGFGLYGFPIGAGPDFRAGWTSLGAAGPVPYPAWVVAHEIGHNWNLRHAPCGNPPDPDIRYPISDGTTGTYGWRASSGRIIPPDVPDFMGYCWPGWTGVYSSSAMILFRKSDPAANIVQAHRAVLVWGEVSKDGAIRVNPAFDIGNRATRPRSGPFRAKLLAPDGRVLRDISFDAPQVEHAGGARVFAFTVAVDNGNELAAIVVEGPGGHRASIRSRTDLRIGPAIPPTLTRLGAGRARITWDSAESERAIVADPRTGSIIAFLRGGTGEIRTDAPEITLLRSDGVRTQSTILR